MRSRSAAMIVRRGPGWAGVKICQKRARRRRTRRRQTPVRAARKGCFFPPTPRIRVGQPDGAACRVFGRRGESSAGGRGRPPNGQGEGVARAARRPAQEGRARAVRMPWSLRSAPQESPSFGETLARASTWARFAASLFSYITWCGSSCLCSYRLGSGIDIMAVPYTCPLTPSVRPCLLLASPLSPVSHSNSPTHVLPRRPRTMPPSCATRCARPLPSATASARLQSSWARR